MGDWALAREDTLKTPMSEATTQMKKATAPETVRFALRPVGTRREMVTTRVEGSGQQGADVDRHLFVAEESSIIGPAPKHIGPGLVEGDLHHPFIVLRSGGCLPER